MDETKGVIGGSRDRKIRQRNRRKLVIAEKEKKRLDSIKELEAKVRKEQAINLIRFLPIVVLGQTFQDLFVDQSKNDRPKSSSNDSFVAFDLPDAKKTSKNFSKKEDLDKELKNGNVLSKKDGSHLKQTHIEQHGEYPKDIDDSSELKNQEHFVNDFPVQRIFQNTILMPRSSENTGFAESASSSNTEFVERLKGRKIVDEYEKQLKDIRYDLRKIIFEYNILVDDEEKVVISREIEDLMDKLSEIIQKIEILKSKMDVENLDKYDDNYIYTLIQGYLSEFRNGEVVSSIKDSPLYVLISEKLNELENKKDYFEQHLEEKKNRLHLKEDSFEELKEKYYRVDKINEELTSFQKRQELLLKEIREKVDRAVTVQEKVEIQAQALDDEMKKIMKILAPSIFIPGKRTAMCLAASVLSYLMFTKRLLHPELDSKKYKIISVQDYTLDIAKTIRSIEDSISILYKTNGQIDKIIYEIENEFSDYIDVVPECKNMLLGLHKMKNQLKEKEYELEKIKKEQELELELNNEKLLTKGIYKA